MPFKNFFGGEPIIIEGSVVEKKKGHISVQLHPGFIVDLKREQCESLEEATDPVTGRTFIKVTLKPDAEEIRAVFQPRLARLAAAEYGPAPFALGGQIGDEYQNEEFPGEVLGGPNVGVHPAFHKTWVRKEIPTWFRGWHHADTTVIGYLKTDFFGFPW